ncbi:carboxymuconolactone decarboxylase family protein [Bacterioplanoides sp.]|uniref:carboxymuconolactone decarboxylase family protein n=1 Tax=Bacterioplanoides sp. TaxID=2066072 RepID=UPI003B000982
MFDPIQPETATGATEEAFAEAKSQFGAVINLFKVAGNAPNVLKGIMAFNKEVANGCELSGAEVELVAMLTSALNRCDYCVNVHMQVGQMHNLSEADLLEAMAAKADSAKSQALLSYTNEVIRQRGKVSPSTLNAALEAGYSEKALLEVIGIVGVYTSLQYIRHVADPEHDFPMVEQFDENQHGA